MKWFRVHHERGGTLTLEAKDAKEAEHEFYLTVQQMTGLPIEKIVRVTKVEECRGPYAKEEMDQA